MTLDLPRRGGSLPFWLLGRRAFVIAALVPVGAGLALGWPWLAAAGIAPVLVSLLPCAAMCALGLCMMGQGNRSGQASGATESGNAGSGPAITAADPRLLRHDA